MRIKNIFISIILIMLLLPCTGWTQLQSYNDMTLEKALSIALGENRDIENAENEDFKAGLQITEAASAAYPVINGFWNSEQVLNPMVFVIQIPDPDTDELKKQRLKIGTDYSMGIGAALTQPLYVGGKVGTAYKAAKIYKNISERTLDATKQQVLAGVVQAFYATVLAKEMLTINRESLIQAERHLKNVQSMYNAGRATEYDLLRAKVNVSNMKPALLEAENQVTVAHLKLKEVMGISPDTPFSILGSLAEPDTSLFADSSVEKAFTRRPDLKARELSVDLYEKNIKIVRGDFLPTLTAGTTFQYMGNFDNFTYDADDWTRYWVASINLSFPIFSGFKNSSKYKQAKVDFHKAKTDYRKSRDTVLIEVRESVLNLRNAVRTIESQRMNVEEAEKALEMVESLYSSGRATQIEVLDTQLALERARINMASALYKGNVAEIILRKNLGIVETNI